MFLNSKEKIFEGNIYIYASTSTPAINRSLEPGTPCICSVRYCGMQPGALGFGHYFSTKQSNNLLGSNNGQRAEGTTCYGHWPAGRSRPRPCRSRTCLDRTRCRSRSPSPASTRMTVNREIPGYSLPSLFQLSSPMMSSEG